MKPRRVAIPRTLSRGKPILRRLTLKFISDGHNLFIISGKQHRARWRELPCNHYIYLQYIYVYNINRNNIEYSTDAKEVTMEMIETRSFISKYDICFRFLRLLNKHNSRELSVEIQKMNYRLSMDAILLSHLTVGTKSILYNA